MKDAYNAAIVGCGRIASGFSDDTLMEKNFGIVSHADGYKQNPNVHLLAAADISHDRLLEFKEKWGVDNLYEDYMEMLQNEKIDILSICTWNSTHFDILEAAIKNNVKAIFCEKPISDSLYNADKMVELAEKNGVILFVNHNRRWDQLYQNIREYISSGGIGELQQISCYYTSGIANSCSHLFDVLRMLFGDVKHVSSWYKGDKSLDDPNMDGYITFNSDVTCTIQSLDVDHYTIFEFDIFGTDGRMRIIDNGFQLKYWKAGKSIKYLGYRELFTKESPITIPKKTMIQSAVKNIVDSLSGSRIPECNGYDGIKSLEIICAFHLSAKNESKIINLPLANREEISIKSL